MIEFWARIFKSILEIDFARLCCMAGRFYKLGCRTGPLVYIGWQNRLLCSLKVHKREKFFISDFEFFIIL
jgi:hypothetical protein